MGGENMHCGMDARRLLHIAGFSTFFSLTGCTGYGGDPVVRDAARPHADAILSDAPALLPQVPMSTMTTTRGQTGEVRPTAGNSSHPGQVAVRLRATVNGIPILDDEVREAVAQYVGELMQTPEALRGQAQQKIYERELQRLIERELVLEEAFERIKKSGKKQIIEDLKKEAGKEADRRLREIKVLVKAKNDEEFKAMLQSQGLSISGMRRQYERNFMQMEYIRNLVYPIVNRISLQQMRDYYEQHPDEYRTEDSVVWQDIFIDASRFASPALARQYAENVLSAARGGHDFVSLVKEFDNGDSRLRNGVGLGNKRNEIIPPQVEPVVWSLKPGEVGPLVDLGFGFHIVRVAERKVAGLRPFDVSCQSEIRKKLQNQIAEREFKRIVDDLKAKASITIYQ